jgi:hypothetical protein
MIGHHFSASAFHQRPEHLWCLSLAWKNLLSDFDQPRLYCRIGKALRSTASNANRRGVHSVGIRALQNQREIAVAQYLSLSLRPDVH